MRTVDRRIAYLLMRLAVGFSLFGHGLVRIPRLSTFDAHLTGQFTNSIVPNTLVSVCGYVLPFVEFCIGLMLVVGVFTRIALVAGVLLMTILVFGSTTIENYSIINEQLIHAAILAVLIVFLDQNSFSIDHALARRRSSVHSP
jgi:thiosulfate dehydrogenase [quinone] large subunit